MSSIARSMGSRWSLTHLAGAVLACAQLGYWTIVLTSRPPAARPAPARYEPDPEPDPATLAWGFGQDARAVPGALPEIRVAGVYAAGPESGALFALADRPPKAVRLGQEVVPGAKLVEVDRHGVTLESGGVRRRLPVPNPEASPQGSPAAKRLAPIAGRAGVATTPTQDAPRASRPPAAAGSLPAIMAPRPEPKP